MPATIKIKNSSTSGAVPTASDLVQGELAVNVADLGLYTENASGTVVKLNAPSIDDKNTGATKHLTISTGGNLGLGVTPSTTAGAWKAIELVNAGNCLVGGYGEIDLANNLKYDRVGGFSYVSTGYASRFVQNGGAFSWFSGTGSAGASAAGMSQAMTLDASGNLGVGTTSPSTRLNVAGPVTVNGAALAANQTSAAVIDYQSTVQAARFFAYGAGSVGQFNWYQGSGGNNPTQTMTLDSSGNLLVGTTSALDGASRLALSVTSGQPDAIHFKPTSNITYYPSVFINSSGTTVGFIQTTSSVTVYSTSSDYRLKNTIAPMTGALAKVAQLKPCTYKWNADGSDGQGFIAHELAEVCPHAVVGEKDAVDEDGNPKYQGIDTSFLVATLTAAIQELKAEFDAYKASHP